MVLNNRPGISEKTRKMVLDAYSAVGGEMNTGRRREPRNMKFIYFVIYKKHGKVVDDTPFFSQLIEGIEQEAKQLGYNIQIAYVSEEAGILSQMPLANSPECRGILVLATEMAEENANMFLMFGKPLLFLDSYFCNLLVDTVAINNDQASRAATAYLISHGHKRIGYLHSGIQINNFDERKDGFYKEMRMCGLPVNDACVFELTPVTDAAYIEMSRLLAQTPELPTAFFADNDIIAISACKALKEHGYKIPEDISITGIDDIPMCEMMEPPLTTMHVPKQQMGSLAVKRLVERIEGHCGEIIKTEVATYVVERKSVRTLGADAGHGGKK